MDSSLKRLLNFFNIAVAKPQSKSNPTGNTMLVPGQKDKKQRDGTVKPIDFPTDVMRAYEYFLQNQQLYNPNRERYELYKSLLFMVRNNGTMNRALRTYITETIEMKEGEKAIQIRSKDKKVEKDFNSWLDKIGFNYNMLNELVYDLVLFGDSFITHDVNDDGIVEISLVDPFLVRDRIELNLNKIDEIRQWGLANKNYVNRFRSIQQIIDQIEGKNKDEVEAYLYFKSYLLGFELKYSVESTDGKDNYRSLPPWLITHFRLFTTKSEFFPFGRPMFINSLAPFQSYKTTEMLIDMLRVAAFPKEIVKIKSSDNATPFDRLQRINEVRELIENITPQTNNKDNLAINERMYSIEDLFEYDVIDTNIDMDKLGDLEKKLDDLVLSTGIADTYLIPSRGNGGMGGESAKALLYNSRIFKRSVEEIKSALLEGFSQMYRLNLTIKDQFSGKDTEFELFMPVNAEMFSEDKVSQDGDQLRLATDFMNNLGQALGMDRGQSLPPKVVKDILNYYLPVDENTVTKWVNMIVKKEEEDEEEAIENAQAGIVDPNAVKKPYEGTPAPLVVPTEGVDAGTSSKPTGTFSNKAKSKKEHYNKFVKKFLESYNNNNDDSDKIIREAYFKAKKENGLTNGVIGKHIYWNDSYSNYTLNEKNSVYNMVKKEKIGYKDTDKLED